MLSARPIQANWNAILKFMSCHQIDDNRRNSFQICRQLAASQLNIVEWIIRLLHEITFIETEDDDDEDDGEKEEESKGGQRRNKKKNAIQKIEK